MKHNWEYKPVSEVFETVTDFVAAGSFADLRDNVIYNSEKDFAQLIRTTDLKNNFSNQQFVYVNEHAFNYLWRVNLSEECIILPNIGNCGEVYYLHPSMLVYPNNVLGPNAIMVRSKSHNQKYLAFALKGSIFQRQLSQIISQVAQSKFNKTNLKKLLLPVPPMEVQEQIVAELDKINEVIANCRELLRNLDALALSLFYDFFGDPITNSKGWEIKPLKDAVIEMFLGPFGSALKTDCYVPEEDSFAMVYEQKHAIKKTLAQENNFINEDKFFALKRFEVLPFDFIMSCRGTIGQLYQVPENAPRGIIHPSVMKIRLNSSTYGSVFFKFLLPIIIKEQQTKGNCVQMAITAKELSAKKLPVPPFSLQEKFADRIEQIEAQKKVLENTIAELQTLLDSRMDYWFN